MRFLAATTRMAMLQATKIAVQKVPYWYAQYVAETGRLTEDDVTIDGESLVHDAVNWIVRRGREVPLNG